MQLDKYHDALQIIASGKAKVRSVESLNIAGTPAVQRAISEKCCIKTTRYVQFGAQQVFQGIHTFFEIIWKKHMTSSSGLSFRCSMFLVSFRAELVWKGETWLPHGIPEERW